MASERASQQAFFGVSALLFAASAAVTIVWCASMSVGDGRDAEARRLDDVEGVRGKGVSDRASSRARMTHPHRAPELHPPVLTVALARVRDAECMTARQRIGALLTLSGVCVTSYTSAHGSVA